MTAPATITRLHPEGPSHEVIGKQVAKQQLVVVDLSTGEQVIDARDEIAGLAALLHAASRKIGSLSRQLEEESDPDLERNGSAREVCNRWKLAAGKKQAQIGKPRIKLVNAAHGWGFPFDSDEHLPDHPTLTLAVDGIAAYPWRHYQRRYRDGEQPNGAERDDDLTHALKDEKHVEQSARLGYAARLKGWTAEGGWPA